MQIAGAFAKAADGSPSRAPPAPAAKPTNKPPCLYVAPGAALFRFASRSEAENPGTLREALRGAACGGGLRPNKGGTKVEALRLSPREQKPHGRAAGRKNKKGRA